MSASIIFRLQFARDMALTSAAILFGRFLPTLKSPPVDLTGKIAIITGSNSGIGLEIALKLAKQGATVYLACRNISKAEEAASQIISQVPASKGRVKTLILDTSSLHSVRAFARDWETLNTKIDILLHNAGVGSAPAGQDFSADGFPMLYATNFLGSFLLTYLLESQLSSDARIVLTSSPIQYSGAFTSNFSLNSIKDNFEPGFHVVMGSSEPYQTTPGNSAYSQTKAMQVAFARLLQRHMDRKAAEAGVKGRRSAHAFSPGLVRTPIFDKHKKFSFFEDPSSWLKMTISVPLSVDVKRGASTGEWLACTNDQSVIGEGMGGGFWVRMVRRLSGVDLMRKDDVERLWVRWEADAGVEWR